MASDFKKLVEEGKISSELFKQHAYVGFNVLIHLKAGVDAKMYAEKLIKEETLKEGYVKIDGNKIDGFVPAIYFSSLAQRREVEGISMPTQGNPKHAIRI